jgi:hypothetical protein
MLDIEVGATTNSQIHGLGWRTTTSLLGVVSEGRQTWNYGGPRTGGGEAGGGDRSPFWLLERVVELDR